MQNRYDNMFKKLAEKKSKAFIPFVALGDPNPHLGLNVIATLIEAGADALELGIPFSDPMADGPTIQNANLRAFTNGINVEKCFSMIKAIRVKYPEIPIGILVYANLVFSNGIDNFYTKCKDAGIDSVLIPDVPIRECTEFKQRADAHGINQIFICPPDATDENIEDLCQYSSGYIYLLSRVGVTGVENQAVNSLKDLAAKLKTHKELPPLIQGFGISTPEHAKNALENGADGVIAGSAVVNIIANNLEQPIKMLDELKKYTITMKNVTL